ncbi:MAG: methyltransferase domain-containing protein, partial [Rhizobiaceae bacterium]
MARQPQRKHTLRNSPHAEMVELPLPRGLSQSTEPSKDKILATASSPAFNLEAYMRSLGGPNAPSTFSAEYLNTHTRRFDETTRLIGSAKRGKRALEIGATDYFQLALGKTFGFDEVWGTIFSEHVEHKFYGRDVAAAGHSIRSTTVSLDIERELFPVTADYFDLILYCEVLEHMDIDPMFALCEFNRILPVGGQLVVTTPNCCSARNTWKILQGYRPHFFM